MKVFKQLWKISTDLEKTQQSCSLFVYWFIFALSSFLGQVYFFLTFTTSLSRLLLIIMFKKSLEKNHKMTPSLFDYKYFSFKMGKFLRSCWSKQKLLGWPKSKFILFYKIEDTFLIFIINFIDLDILSILAISCVV